MKKNISINISGIIFHIEEDGFETLKNYLNAITKYFSSYDDSIEIIADIEGRIAEIFLSKLNDEKQVITMEDVDSLKVTMGSVSDFQAAEETADESYAEEARETKREKREYAAHAPKKLYRDEKRKLIAGVASGIAHYFSVDPLWVRLIFLLAFFDVFNLFTITGIVLITYVVMWIIVPISDSLEEDERVKHFFRNPEDNVIGGVSSGLAAYFSIDAAIVRVAFVLTTFMGGVGLITYLILWIITPEAKSLTERMQMEGEPITLENIERKIRDRFNIHEGEEEGTIAKILLFPFRLIKSILSNVNADMRPLARFLFNVLTTIVGAALALASASATFSLLIILGIFFGVISEWPQIEMNEVPLHLVRNTIPPITVAFTFIVAWIPIIFMGILGVSLIAKQMITRPVLNWSLLGIWIIGIIGAGTTVPLFVTNFQADGTHKKNVIYEMPKDQPMKIRVNPTPSHGYNEVTLTIRGHEKEHAELLQRLSAKGSSRQKAIENAHLIRYQVDHAQEDELVFDASYSLDENAPFRDQRLRMNLYLPYGKEFVMSEELVWIIRNTLYKNGYTEADLGNNRWVYEEDGLKCLTCESESKIKIYHEENGMVKKSFDLDESIDRLHVEGPYTVIIKPSERNYAYLYGEEWEVDKTDFEVREGKLRLHSKHRAFDAKKVQVVLHMKELDDLKARGNAELRFVGWDQNSLSLELRDATNCELEGNINDLAIVVRDRARIIVNGKGDELNVEARDAGVVRAYGFQANEVNVEARDGSMVKVNAKNYSSIKERDGARVSVKGNAKVKEKDD
ncbi:MAG: PspC domain-containing protein [Flammeovirgaceae bacterium]